MAAQDITVGLSGGVDSCATALLLREMGYRVQGVTMRLGLKTDDSNVAAAAEMAAAFKIPFRVLDLSEVWRREVLDYFHAAYARALTPNPCVRCNEYVKMNLLPKLATSPEGLFATGHYAQLKRKSDGSIGLYRAADLTKDQSYFLYRMPLAQRARTLFPLGTKLKEEIRAWLFTQGFTPAANRADSQDFCAGSAADLLQGVGVPGDIVDAQGNLLGRHSGFQHYTIGQRKGLGIGGAGEPWYVIKIDAAQNRVVVGRKDETICKELSFEDRIGTFEGPCRVKVRSNGRLAAASVVGNRCIFPEGISGVAPGQSVVFYGEDDELLGGGIIAAR